jgi:23S rRNA (uridine2552-2'-O)-methyltransferase
MLMSKKWQKDRKKEYYYRRAKSEQYRSRASFKLKQLNKRFRLIKKKDSVLDLGASPGGWMQVAGELVGESGYVLGVDLEEIEPFEDKNITSIKGDITVKETVEAIIRHKSTFDVVICDASPDISGVWDVDHFNSVELSRHALRIAKEVLREGGNFLVKVFQGAMVSDFTSEVKREFEFSKIAKPKASRQRSSEVYIVGKGILKTPVKYGDVLEVTVSEAIEGGYGISLIDGFKLKVKDGRHGEKVKVKIKKVTRKLAWALKV